MDENCRQITKTPKEEEKIDSWMGKYETWTLEEDLLGRKNLQSKKRTKTLGRTRPRDFTWF
jgi:hypothetical protein